MLDVERHQKLGHRLLGQLAMPVRLKLRRLRDGMSDNGMDRPCYRPEPLRE